MKKKLSLVSAIREMRRGAVTVNRGKFYRITKAVADHCAIQVWQCNRWEYTAILPVNGWRNASRNDAMAIFYSQLP